MRFILVLLSLLMSFSVQAADVAIEVGVRSQSGDVESPASAKSQLGFQLGATSAFELSGAWNFRTGMLYTQRPLTVESGGTEVKNSMNYLDIPVTVLYKFEEYAGIFGGLNLSMLFDKSSEVQDAKSMLTPLVFGATFKFAPQIGGTIYFETAAGEAAQGLENYRAIGINLAVSFE